MSVIERKAQGHESGDGDYPTGRSWRFATFCSLQRLQIILECDSLRLHAKQFQGGVESCLIASLLLSRTPIRPACEVRRVEFRRQDPRDEIRGSCRRRRFDPAAELRLRICEVPPLVAGH